MQILCLWTEDVLPNKKDEHFEINSGFSFLLFEDYNAYNLADHYKIYYINNQLAVAQ